MTPEDIKAKIARVLREQLGAHEDQLTPESSLIDDHGADSIDVMEVCMALEEEFEISITDEDFDASCNTVGELNALMCKLLRV